ncbi:MAG TPA: FHA domain-containing protein [Rhodanobacteraceae bacterium]|nr:FHA domain-containing protein [Rhodanobacteraceae bacterium]
MTDSDERTRVRAALPAFVLRGVSGSTFGKRFAVVDSMTIGRQGDSDIVVPSGEISRHHARLKAAADGVMVEDLGSANGTFINDKRIQSGLLKPGDELRLDTVRFLLASSAMDLRQQAGGSRTAKPSPPRAGSGARAITVAIALVMLVIFVFGALRYLG